MQVNKYVGIKFKDKGRDTNGIDCWGLARLIYKNEYNIDLPSFTSDYEADDTIRMQELIAQYKEGWEKLDQPQEGSIVVFKVLGHESHIGVAVNKDQFLHAREGQDSAIESFSSPSWNRRIVGHFKYSENKSAILNAIPHPLRTERYTIPILPGTTLKQLAEGLTKEYGIAPELKSKVTVLVNGRVIDQSKWEETELTEKDSVEYRAVAGKSALRTIALIAIAYYAPILAGQLTGYTAAASAATIMGTTVTTSLAVTNAVVTMGLIAAGGMLVNAIAPVRPPAEPRDPGSSERQLMVDGAANTATPYNAIPVVLGKVRLTPPLGSNNFVTFENERDSFVSMLLTWGYGPLVIDYNTLKIGEMALANYTDYKIATIDYISEPTIDEQAYFDSIYGKDTTQVNVNTELVCDGNPEFYPRNFSGIQTDIFELGTVLNLPLSDIAAGQNIEAYFTSNTTNWTLLSNNISNIVVTNINSTTKKVTATVTSSGGIFDPTFLRYSIDSSATGTYTGTAFGPTPGPWIEAISSEPVDSATVSIHFPQGLRKIIIQGDGAGNSYPAPVQFRLEYFYAGVWSLWKVLTVGANAVKKDAFTWNETIAIPTIPINNGLTIRIRRESGDNTEDNPNFRYYHQSLFYVATFIRNAKPMVNPVGTKIAKTAFKIKATDQLNGRMDGFNAIVQTYALSWNGTTWGLSATNNPADLFRYVLEHPANPRKVSVDQLDLASIQHWSEYCTTKGFTYNSVLASQRSILEVLRDICAAGRASPALINGKWSVIIDEPKNVVIQHFSPHNSWGFEGVKSLPKYPDGLRVTYFDEDQNYQENEIIVYAVGKNETNAELFESIQLPGVTKSNLVIDHARWHMAQAKLRPEVYTLNADIEYLVCNRGDRVKVSHDVPMWGLGSGRIKRIISSTQIELDEEMPMLSGTTYTIRFRSKLGGTTTRTVASKTESANYSIIELTTSISTADADVSDLFLFGQLNQESQDLLVLSIEPTGNKTARLTLVDYGVTDTYNIFTDYQSLTAETVFESQITLSPLLQRDTFGDKKPTVTAFISDESVMDLIAKGVFRYNLNVSYVNASNLPENTVSVEAQYDFATASDSVGIKSVNAPYDAGALSIKDVVLSETYKVRLRYVSTDGRTGQWTDWENHTIIGKTSPPGLVKEFTATASKNTGNVLLRWENNPELDIQGYEVRSSDTGWGTNDDLRLFYGEATSCFVAPPSTSNSSKTYYIKAFDSSGNYSVNAAQVSYFYPAVTNITDISYVFSYTALTNASVTLSWVDVTSTTFALDYYEVITNDATRIVKANTITIPADWLSDKTFTIKVVDILGQKSTGYSEDISKAPPSPPTNFRAQVIDNTVMLYWDLPEITTLPIDHVLIKKGADWNTATVIGDKKGGFTTVNETAAGVYTYLIASVDTDNNESLPTAISVNVAEPPDFILHGDFTSDFSATKVSARLDDDGSVYMPINITETFQQHFDTRSWANPQDQVSAGYPIYIQPTVGTGYYEEVFDFGSVLSSSKISLNYLGTVISGTPVVTPKISISVDNVTYIDYNGVTEIYAINFRYVKIRITANETTGTGLYALSYLYVKLDAKLKNDAEKVSAVSTDALGTIVNFGKEFVDVISITLTPSGTTPTTAVYDFLDSNLSATYSITSNVCTVTYTAHGLIAGQDVRFQVGSGSAIAGVYTITSSTANTFTFNLTTANTSGNCLIYPESFRVYLFNSSGTRVSGTVSWSVKGY